MLPLHEEKILTRLIKPKDNLTEQNDLIKQRFSRIEIDLRQKLKCPQPFNEI